MDQYLSAKLKVISFLSMIMVVYLHSYNMLVKFTDGNIVVEKKYSFFIQEFTSQGISRVAVPLFFIISGYLFFYNSKGKFHDFALKIKKRVKTLLIPYLFWSVWSLFVFFFLQLIPASKDFFTNKLISDYSLPELLNAIFINPFAYQLWFLRDLFLLVCISPLIWILIKYFKYWPLFLLLIGWYFNIDYKVISNESVFYFVFGSTIGILNKNMLQIQMYKTAWPVLFIWLLLILFKTIVVYMGLPYPLLVNGLHKGSIFVGVFAVWTIYDSFPKAIFTEEKLVFTTFSFFLYAFHEPALTIFKKGAFAIFGKEELVSLVVFLTLPIFIILTSIFLGSTLKRILPKFYKTITGGR